MGENMRTKSHRSVERLGMMGLGLLIAQGALIAPYALAGSSSACSNNTAGGTQANRQCQAGAAADDASNKNTVAGMVYTGAAASCAVACYQAYYGGSMEPYCTEATMGAGITEAALSGDMMSAATSLSGPAMQMAMKDSGSTAAAAGSSAGKGSKFSCVTTAVDALQAANQFTNAGSNAAAAKQAYGNAASLASSSGSPTYSPGNVGGSDSGAAAAGGSGGSIASTGSGGDACAIGAQTGNPSAVLQCASSIGDPNLKAIVSNPNFLSGVRNATGMSPSDFFNKARDEGSGKAIAGALSGTASSGDFMSKLGNVLVAAQKDATSRASNVGYASSGGGRAPASSKGKDMSETLAELMAKLQQKPEEEKKDENNLAFAFKGERYPANVAENRNVSLFERVTFRYYRAAPRLVELPKTRSN